MANIKGLVLLSRFEYLEYLHGPKLYKEFLKKISTVEQNFARQPVDGANFYSDNTLARIDQILLQDYFDSDVEEFRKLGEWSAQNLMDKYFNLYAESQKPVEFLEQFARLRMHLIGSGKMSVLSDGKNSLLVIIDYGQNVPRSVCLSEQGFITGGMHGCGAKDVKIVEETCASTPDYFECKLRIKYK
jgi:hypothetical protein